MLRFIPRPQHAETRYIGSWVCPCLSCAVTMVSQWAGLLVAPPGNEDVAQEVLPQSVTFNLDLGMTSEEQLGCLSFDYFAANKSSAFRFSSVLLLMHLLLFSSRCCVNLALFWWCQKNTSHHLRIAIFAGPQLRRHTRFEISSAKIRETTWRAFRKPFPFFSAPCAEATRWAPWA